MVSLARLIEFVGKADYLIAAKPLLNSSFLTSKSSLYRGF